MNNNKIQFKVGGWYEITNVYHKTTETYRCIARDDETRICKGEKVRFYRFQSLKDGGVLGLDTGDFRKRYTFKEIEGNNALNAEMEQSIERCNRIYEWCSTHTCD